MKRFEGLEARLELLRLPKGLRTPGDIKMLTARLTFKALNDNKAPTENFTRSVAKLNRKEEIQAIIDSGEQIIVKSCDELLEFIAAVLGKDVINVNLHGYHTNKRFEEAEFPHIFVFFAVSLGFSFSEIQQGRMLPFTERGIFSPEILELTRKHIVSNRPEILKLGEKIGINFTTQKISPEIGSTIIAGVPIIVKKCGDIKETFDAIYSNKIFWEKIGIDIDTIFSESKNSINTKQKLSEKQKLALNILKKLLQTMHTKHGDKWTINDLLSKKTGIKLSIVRTFSDFGINIPPIALTLL